MMVVDGSQNSQNYTEMMVVDGSQNSQNSTEMMVDDGSQKSQYSTEKMWKYKIICENLCVLCEKINQ
jgi:hypothetical protein